MPPLRERGPDIVELAGAFLLELRNDQGLEVSLSEASREALRQHAWPGNVRELKNCIERAAYLKRSGELRPAELRLSPSGTGTKASAVAELFEGAPGYEAAHVALDRVLLARALDDSGGNLSQAARRLGISRPTLRAKLRAVELYPAGCA